MAIIPAWTEMRDVAVPVAGRDGVLAPVEGERTGAGTRLRLRGFSAARLPGLRPTHVRLRSFPPRGLVRQLRPGSGGCGTPRVGYLGRHRGGGEAYELYFMGLAERAGQQDTLRFVSLESDSEEEVRAGLTQMFKLGLVRYAVHTPAASLLDIRYAAPQQAQQQATATTDPWKLWVFSVRAGAEIDGESRQSSQSFEGRYRRAARPKT